MNKYKQKISRWKIYYKRTFELEYQLEITINK